MRRCDLSTLFFSALTLLVWRQEGIRSVKKLGVGMLVVMICTSYSFNCHHHLDHPCSNNIQNANPEFWYHLTRVVQKKLPLNECCCCCCSNMAFMGISAMLLLLSFEVK